MTGERGEPGPAGPPGPPGPQGRAGAGGRGVAAVRPFLWLTGDLIPFSTITKHVQFGHGAAMLVVIDAPLNLIFAVIILHAHQFHQDKQCAHVAVRAENQILQYW